MIVVPREVRILVNFDVLCCCPHFKWGVFEAGCPLYIKKVLVCDLTQQAQLLQQQPGRAIAEEPLKAKQAMIFRFYKYYHAVIILVAVDRKAVFGTFTIAARAESTIRVF